uniref:Receptor-like serine/threonine-protein kinase n=1 Tax=Kalanchoe fedtschenkoi TaxID=63787 RepID=A0A7N0V0A1_KALFE
MLPTPTLHLRTATPPLLLLLALALLPPLCHSSDAISATQWLSVNQTLVSRSGEFELGFFKPGDLSSWYVGIWYKNIPDRVVVWVANRDDPVKGPNGVLQIDGNRVVIRDGARARVWASNSSTEPSLVNPVAQILDTGNFVLKEAEDSGSSYAWQSFDHPTDTLLPEMRLGWDSKTGLDRYIRSWKSPDDPSSGDFTFKLNRFGFPEIFLWRGDVRIYRSGPWIGPRFSGVPEMKPSAILDFEFVTDADEVYYQFVLRDKSILSRLVVNSTGSLQRFTWVPSGQVWNPFWYAPKDQCDSFRECGTWGICDTNSSPVCKCPPGFKPSNPQAWTLRDGSSGCVRTTELECGSDGFLPVKNMKLPESTAALVYPDMSLAECAAQCGRNCSCNGYSNRLIDGSGSGCVMWAGGLEDLREYGDGTGGQTLFIRLAAADLAAVKGRNDSDRRKGIAKFTGIAVGMGILLLALGVYVAWKARALARVLREQQGSHDRSQDMSRFGDEGVSSKKEYPEEGQDGDLDLPLFDFSVIKMCSGGFCDTNKLGQGGFGSVYKGALPDGQLVAIKRLAKNSGQGMDEFKNEVKLIARLQHRNLVRLVGCCVEMDEKVLIYEYLPNRSLDSILFNRERSTGLDWPKRFHIICGIARGLLYLHQDSRFRIIHRDLKASNILLDGDLNPKISDFGMARIFGRDQTEANTRRVVGTYGYMAPEYAMDGLFSVKSDVFSFGVLVLEIVSGKKNRGFYYENHELNLLGHTWNFWKDGRGLEIMDLSAGDGYSTSEVRRCIQVGLLCVQERAEDRPTMSSVVLMLSSETASMRQPKQPGFCLRRNPLESDSSSSKRDIMCCTENQMTVTILDGR